MAVWQALRVRKTTRCLRLALAFVATVTVLSVLRYRAAERSPTLWSRLHVAMLGPAANRTDVDPHDDYFYNGGFDFTTRLFQAVDDPSFVNESQQLEPEQAVVMDTSPAPADTTTPLFEDPEWGEKALATDNDNIRPGDPYWQWVDPDWNLMFYSAFYDDVQSPPFVRVVALARYPLAYHSVRCSYYACHNCPVRLTVSGEVVHIRHKNGRRYLAAFVLCPLDRAGGLLPFSVSVQREGGGSLAKDVAVHYSNLTAFKTVFLQARRAAVDLGIAMDDRDAERLKLLEETGFVGIQANDNRNDGQSAEDGYSHIGGSGVQGRATNAAFRWNVTRCFPALHSGYDEHTSLVETVAASKALGVDRFVFYVESVGPRVNKTLHILKKQGLVDILPWNLHVQRRDVFYKGQFSAVEDCLFRHLHSSKYLLFGDLDELFVPKASDNLGSLLDESFKRQPECASFQFLNVFFKMDPSPSSLSGAGLAGGALWSNGAFGQRQQWLYRPSRQARVIQHMGRRYGLRMLTNTLRERNPWQRSLRSKLALDPRRVITASVHVVGKLRKGFRSCAVPSSDGLLHHYRQNVQIPDRIVVQDLGLLRYANPVVQETARILREVEEQQQ